MHVPQPIASLTPRVEDRDSSLAQRKEHICNQAKSIVTRTSTSVALEAAVHSLLAVPDTAADFRTAVGRQDSPLAVGAAGIVADCIADSADIAVVRNSLLVVELRILLVEAAADHIHSLADPAAGQAAFLLALQPFDASRLWYRSLDRSRQELI